MLVSTAWMRRSHVKMVHMRTNKKISQKTYSCGRAISILLKQNNRSTIIVYRHTCTRSRGTVMGSETTKWRGKKASHNKPITKLFSDIKNMERDFQANTDQEPDANNTQWQLCVASGTCNESQCDHITEYCFACATFELQNSNEFSFAENCEGSLVFPIKQKIAQTKARTSKRDGKRAMLRIFGIQKHAANTKASQSKWTVFVQCEQIQNRF